MVERDQCAWGQLLAGGNERISGNNTAVLVGAIGCVDVIDAFDRIYAVTIAWQGASAGAAPIVDRDSISSYRVRS